MTTSGDLGGIGDFLQQEARNHIYEGIAENVADKLRAEGRNSTKGVELDIANDAGIELDEQRIRDRVDEILAGG